MAGGGGGGGVARRQVGRGTRMAGMAEYTAGRRPRVLAQRQ